MMNPEAVSDFSLVSREHHPTQFQRIKSSEAAHEISQVMQAAAKSQREASANAAKQQHLPV